MRSIKNLFHAFWRISTSPVTFVGLSLLWCLDLGVGSVVAYHADPQFSGKMDAYPFNVWFSKVAPRMLPDSLWVYILVWLTWFLVGSLFLCTVNWFLNRRRWRKGLGEVLVHLGFLLIFLGFVVGSVAGTRIQGIVVDLSGTQSINDTPLSLSLHQLDQTRDRYGKVLDTVSVLELLSAGEPVARSVVRLNHPLIWRSAVIYPRGSRQHIQRVHLSFGGRRVGPLGEGDEGALPSGMSIGVERIVQPGEQSGYVSGPAVLVRVGPSGSPMHQKGWLVGGAGTGRVRLFGTEVVLAGSETAVQGIYDLHTDPGVRLVLPGAVILGVGTLWSLAGYLGFVRRRDSVEVSA